MALRAIHPLTDTHELSRPTLATVTALRPTPRMVALAAQRRERRKWYLIGIAGIVAPFVACVAVLEVVR